MIDSAETAAKLIMRAPAEERFEILNVEINGYLRHPVGSRERAKALDFNARLVSAISTHCLREGINAPWLAPRIDA